MPTAWEDFKERWSDCTLCHYHKTRNNICLAKGKIPADVVVVGEAPGLSEDVLGKPFVGPAGLLLDSILKRVAKRTGLNPRIAYTNIVCCLPVDVEAGTKAVEPEWECVEACKPRLEEFLQLCRPQLIVTVGKSSKSVLEPGYRGAVSLPAIGGDKPELVHIVHPAYILRLNIAQRGLAIQRCVVNLVDAYEKLRL